MMEQDRWDLLLAYLDDFFGLELESEEAWVKFRALWSLLEELGFPINKQAGEGLFPLPSN
jgi:hypothetical protein